MNHYILFLILLAKRISVILPVTFETKINSSKSSFDTQKPHKSTEASWSKQEHVGLSQFCWSKEQAQITFQTTHGFFRCSFNIVISRPLAKKIVSLSCVNGLNMCFSIKMVQNQHFTLLSSAFLTFPQWKPN